MVFPSAKLTSSKLAGTVCVEATLKILGLNNARLFSPETIITFISFFFDLSSLRTADVFPVVASLPPKNNACEPDRQIDFRERYFSQGEKRRPEIRLRFAGYDLFCIWKKHANKQTNKQEQQTKQNFCLEAFKGLFRPQKS